MRETGDLSFVSSEIQGELESATFKIERQIETVGHEISDVEKDLMSLRSQIEFELYSTKTNLEKLEHRVSRLEKDFEKARKREIVTVIVVLFLFLLTIGMLIAKF